MDSVCLFVCSLSISRKYSSNVMKLIHVIQLDIERIELEMVYMRQMVRLQRHSKVYRYIMTYVENV